MLEASSTSTTATAEINCAYSSGGTFFGGGPYSQTTTVSGQLVDLTCPATEVSSSGVTGTRAAVAAAQARADAAYGDIAVFGASSGEFFFFDTGLGFMQGVGGFSRVDASYTDSITVTGPASGTLRFAVSLTGTSTFLHSGYGSFLTVSGTRHELNIAPATPGDVIIRNFTIDVPFSAGVSIPFSASTGFGIGAGGGSSFSGSVRQTVAILVLDSNGDASSTAVRTFESGATYASTPEPGTLALVGVSVGLLRLRHSLRKIFPLRD